MKFKLFKEKFVPRKNHFYNEVFTYLLVSKTSVNLIVYPLTLLMIIIFPAEETELFFYTMAVGSIIGGLLTLGGTYYNLISLQQNTLTFLSIRILLISLLIVLFLINLFQKNSGVQISELLGIVGENIIIISLFISITTISYCTLLLSSSLKLLGKFTFAAFIERLSIISCFIFHTIFFEIRITVLCIILLSIFLCFYTIFSFKSIKSDTKLTSATPKIVISIYYYELLMVNIPLIGALYFFDAETGIWFRLISLLFAVLETFTQSRLLQSRHEDIGILQLTNLKSATILLISNLMLIYFFTNLFEDQYLNIVYAVTILFITMGLIIKLKMDKRSAKRYNNIYDLVVCVISLIFLFICININDVVIYKYLICIIFIRLNPMYFMINSSWIKNYQK